MINSDGLRRRRIPLFSHPGTSLVHVIAPMLVGVMSQVACAEAADAQSLPRAKSQIQAEAMFEADETPTGAVAKPDAKSVEDMDADRFCKNISSLASEQRYAWQLRNLISMQNDIDERIEKLEALRADVQDWIGKRDKVLSEVKDHIIQVYERMRPEAAAERLASVEDDVAIALLAKMKPRVVSAILNEMDAGKASQLTQAMASLVEIKPGDEIPGDKIQ
nr:MotE family protein [uncultured Cohaesibacter sp.]